MFCFGVSLCCSVEATPRKLLCTKRFLGRGWVLKVESELTVRITDQVFQGVHPVWVKGHLHLQYSSQWQHSCCERLFKALLSCSFTLGIQHKFTQCFSLVFFKHYLYRCYHSNLLMISFSSDDGNPACEGPQRIYRSCNIQVISCTIIHRDGRPPSEPDHVGAC